MHELRTQEMESNYVCEVMKDTRINYYGKERNNQ